jgi:hypothetical protein
MCKRGKNVKKELKIAKEWLEEACQNDKKYCKSN